VYSRDHALLSAVLGLAVAGLAPPDASPALLWLYVVGLGVGIDVDHFLVARLERGDWRNLRRCLADPSRVLLDQPSIFEAGDLWRDQRLLSHALVGGALVAALWPVADYWALATAAALYVHVVADLYHDARTRADYLRRGAEVVGE
jgi:hypothetical protein